MDDDFWFDQKEEYCDKIHNSFIQWMRNAACNNDVRSY